jgi:hypothetical protein
MQAKRSLGAALLAASLALPLVARAQATSGSTRGPIRYGAIAGATMASITEFDQLGSLFGELAGTSPFESRKRVGFQGGLFAQIPVAANISLQPELHYVQKGGGLEITDPVEGSASFGWDFGYFELPVLLRVDLGSARWRPFVTAGPSIALRSSCNFVIEAEGATAGVPCNSSLLTDSDIPLGDDPTPGDGELDAFKKTDVGAQVGAGVAGTLGGRAVFVQLRYAQSLSTIAKETAFGFAPKNRSIALVFGVGF